MKRTFLTGMWKIIIKCSNVNANPIFKSTWVRHCTKSGNGCWIKCISSTAVWNKRLYETLLCDRKCYQKLDLFPNSSYKNARARTHTQFSSLLVNPVVVMSLVNVPGKRSSQRGSEALRWLTGRRIWVGRKGMLGKCCESPSKKEPEGMRAELRLITHHM